MQTRQIGSEIRIIGPALSGKTTYLATLLDFYHKQKVKSEEGINIEPKNSDDPKDPARILQKWTNDILRKGDSFSSTFKQTMIPQYPTYALRVNFPATKITPETVIELITKDYDGETFENIPKLTEQNRTNQFLNDLFTAKGWLIILTDCLPEEEIDKKVETYKKALDKLGNELKERGQENPEITKIRVAVVMSKCERGEIWPCRLDAEQELFAVRLPEIRNSLREKIPAHNLKFFACSSFGIMDDRRDKFNPRPNRFVPDDGSPKEYSACIREENIGQWRPFGLISPIYWLATGEMLSNPRL